MGNAKEQYKERILTAERFKTNKGLESCNQLVCGRVKKIQTWRQGGKIMITGHIGFTVCNIIAGCLRSILL